jgi:hypothetical protein
LPTIEHKITFDKAFEGIASHVKRHKVAYSFGAGIAIAGITCLIIGKNVKSSLDTGANGSEMTTLHSFFFSLFANNSGHNVVTTVHTGGRGHPGFRVKHPATNLDFDTQGAAARAFHIPETIVSKHLNGKIPNAYGEVFERIAV